MFNIAVCDDSIEDINIIKGILNQYGEHIDYYTDGRELSKKATVINYDAFFIDIEMEGINGIELAELIRKKNRYVYVIFVTNREDLVFNTLKFQPFGFIRKQYINEELGEIYLRLLERLREDSFIFAFDNKNAYRMEVKGIMYLEGGGHNVIVHMTDGDKILRGRLSDYEKELAPYSFVRVHKCYIVNVRHIKSIDSKEIRLWNGTEIPVGRKESQNVKDVYMMFRRKSINGNRK